MINNISIVHTAEVRNGEGKYVDIWSSYQSSYVGYWLYFGRAAAAGVTLEKATAAARKTCESCILLWERLVELGVKWFEYM